MYHRITKLLHLDRYVNSGLILTIDLAASCASSIMALFIVRLISSQIGESINEFLFLAGFSFLFSYLAFFLMRTHHQIIRHSTLREIGKIAIAVVIKDFLLAACMVIFIHQQFYINNSLYLLLVLDFFITVFVLVFVRIMMIAVYDVVNRGRHDQSCRQQILVYGTGQKSVSQLMRLQDSPHYKIVGFIINDRSMKGQRINKLPIFSFTDEKDINTLKTEYSIDAVLFSTPEEAKDEQKSLLKYCLQNNVRILLAPRIDEVVDGVLKHNDVREIKIEDLLGRPEIKISMKEITENFEGKTVMVTGAAGSIGSELCRQLAGFGVELLILFDNAETPMHNLRLNLEEKYPQLNFVPVIGDVRQLERVDFVMRKYRPQVVFHAAAYKHVPLMEENPCEAVLVNVIGTEHVAQKCVEYEVERMVMISTDKAVNPTNVMGCTKRLAEILVQSLGTAIEKGKVHGKTKFVTTRFGNVLGSNGSVIPRFREQISKGGPITVTHPEITRFFMTIPEACRLVMEAATMNIDNKIMVFDMGESVKIADLAKRMIELAGLEVGKDIKINYVGLRPGEKLYEEVLATAENTIPTTHERINVAKVRDYDYEDIIADFLKMEELSRAVKIREVVILMKRIVPEYVSQNSRFASLDKSWK